ncbi:MAG: 1-(5-phosphoribosyl)-5-[(5-phosphoribosylamino)methylideneamino]imidazole-4-carboxamide isomerase [Christensenellaceae bacterium]|jgi:phosphoribosylformimino-5-aminoimidazole carboxamide ribotide isomerase|nr:1-(5-phosphoribosyl)-5-[(5-phosphoribosylamino)methylideneamino]imidazole-4-carboxamide isomerase [Christensenellaceae bacterium]
MIIYPAIDLLDGKCVRLYQGNYSLPTQVADDPVETAKAFIEDGAKYLHVVDLNGAKTGSGINFPIIEKLSALGLRVQTGGGIRDLDRIAKFFDIGVKKVILGSAAVTNPPFLKTALNKYGEKIIVGVDMKDGIVRTSGWIKDTNLDYIDFSLTVADMGATSIIYTDINRDGTLEGIDIKPIEVLKQKVKNLELIVGGGINGIKDIKKLKDLGMDGAVCGRSLYSRFLSLKEALELCADAR